MKAKTYVKGVAALCALAAVACTGVQQSRGDVAVYLDESQPPEMARIFPLTRTRTFRLKNVSRTPCRV